MIPWRQLSLRGIMTKILLEIVAYRWFSILDKISFMKKSSIDF